MAKGQAMSGITPDVVEAHGLSPEEYERVLSALGREPNLGGIIYFGFGWFMLRRPSCKLLVNPRRASDGVEVAQRGTSTCRPEV